MFDFHSRVIPAQSRFASREPAASGPAAAARRAPVRPPLPRQRPRASSSPRRQGRPTPPEPPVPHPRARAPLLRGGFGGKLYPCDRLYCPSWRKRKLRNSQGREAINNCQPLSYALNVLAFPSPFHLRFRNHPFPNFFASLPTISWLRSLHCISSMPEEAGCVTTPLTFSLFVTHSSEGSRGHGFDQLSNSANVV